MEPVETLMNEHRLIESVLSSLEIFAEQIQQQDSIPSEESERHSDLRDYVSFFRNFADATHHGKEENILFETMISAGFSKEQGPIAVMLSEHGEGRNLVGILSSLAEKKESWTEQDRNQLYEAASGYSYFLKSHISKEDNILYPMAERNLSPSQQEAMASAFENFDGSAGQLEQVNQMLATAQRLMARYEAAPSCEDSSDCEGCCCGH